MDFIGLEWSLYMDSYGLMLDYSNYRWNLQGHNKLYMDTTKH
jgi:hypothetical protein